MGVDGPEVPLSIALTEFHFLLLYKDRIAAVCNLNEKLTYEEILPLVITFLFIHCQHSYFQNSNQGRKFED